jgi:hypothetical protein
MKLATDELATRIENKQSPKIRTTGVSEKEPNQNFSKARMASGAGAGEG